MSSSGRNNNSGKPRAGGRGGTRAPAPTPTPNAWHKPLQTRPPPGLEAPAAPGVERKVNGTVPKENSQSLQMRERFLHLVLSLVGQRVVLTQTNGGVLEGVLHTFTPFLSQPFEARNKYVLKAVNVISDKGGDEVENGSTVIISTEKVVSVHVKSMRLEANGKDTGSSFRTDTEISAAQGNKSRDLVAAGSAWTSTSGKSRADALMHEAPKAGSGGVGGGTLRGKIGEWDQFKANEELFDVHASFDENLYTTALDKSSIDSAKIKEAERLAREIEGSTSSNMHVAEERNQVVQGDYDEEDRYSGVLTSSLETRRKDPPMNYAKAALKGEKTKAVVPPGFLDNDEAETKEESVEAVNPEIEQTETKEQLTENGTVDRDVALAGNVEVAEEAAVSDANAVEAEAKNTEKVEPQPEGEEKGRDSTAGVKEMWQGKEERGEEKKEPKKISSKLNANAREFTLNPTAKTFTPGNFGAASTPATPATATPGNEVPVLDPSAVQGMPQQQFIPVGQHGLMPMIANPAQFAMRYPGFPLDHMAQMQPHSQPQHMQQVQQAPNQTQEIVHGDEQQQAETPQHQGQQPQPQHPGVPMHYPGGQGFYPSVAVRQAAHPMYHPVMGAHQQVPVQAYRGGYVMHQAPPHMRGPNGPPTGYYPGTQPHYSQYGMEEDGRYGRGGRGGRNGRRNSRKSGRGGRGYHGNGRQTPQNNHEDGILEGYTQEESKDHTAVTE